MKPRRFSRSVATAVLAWATALPAVALSPEAKRGQKIFLEGRSVSGVEITAVIGDGGSELPASMMPCGSCHGQDGRGQPEGGISPSNLTWRSLTKPYGADLPNGRRHPPYQEKTLGRAITMGFDPAGNKLHVAMPRYRLSRQDLGDLVAYIRQLGDDRDPGISDEVLTLATLLPTEDTLAPVGEAMAAVLEATFDDVNRAGGIYTRRLELRVEPAPADPVERAEALHRLAAAGEAFALVSPFFAGAEAEIGDLDGIPTVGPYTRRPRVGSPLDPSVFCLLSGDEDLGRALVTFAAGDEEGPGADASDAEAPGTAPRAMVIAEDGFEAPAGAIRARAAELGWPEVRAPAPPLTDLEAASLDTDTVFLLARGAAQRAFFERAAALDWRPRVYLPGSLAGPEVFDVPPGFAGRIRLAMPNLPAAADPQSLSEFRDLAERHDLPPRHHAAQIAALSAARVLIEGLKQAGRDLSREKLIAALEGISAFRTGLVPPITYGPNQRIGAAGAYVVAVDLDRRTLVPLSGWIEAR